MYTNKDVSEESIEEDKSTPKVATQFTNSRTNAKKPELMCTMSEDEKACVLTHAAAGWDVKEVAMEHVDANPDGLGGKLKVKGGGN